MIVSNNRVDDAVARVGTANPDDGLLLEGGFYAEVFCVYHDMLDVESSLLEHAPDAVRPRPDQAASEVTIDLEGAHDIFLFGLDGEVDGEPWPTMTFDPAVAFVRVRVTGWGREQVASEIDDGKHESRVGRPPVERYLVEVWPEAEYRSKQIFFRNAKLSAR